MHNVKYNPSARTPHIFEGPERWVEHHLPTRGGSYSVTFFLMMSLIACILGAVLVPSGLGFIVGYEDVIRENHENAKEHYQRALGYLAENYPDLAITEFEIAVKYDSSYEPAQQKLRELQATLGTRGTPGTVEESRVVVSLFDESRELISKKEWSDAINRLEQLKNFKPDFRAQEVGEFLYLAYVEGAKEAVATGHIELARERFDAALAIHNSNGDLRQQRDIAALYLEGQEAAGYNWPTAIQKFSALYQLDPNYNDVKKRLLDAYVQYGDNAAKQNAWCLAAREYENATTISNDASIGQKRSQASSLCRQALSATPTPSVVPTSVVEVYVGKKSTTNDVCTGSGDLIGTVRDGQGRPIAGVTISYSTESGLRNTTRTNVSGQYLFTLGKDPGVFQVTILSADGKNLPGVLASMVYSGGNNIGCHMVLDWQKVQ